MASIHIDKIDSIFDLVMSELKIKSELSLLGCDENGEFIGARPQGEFLSEFYCFEGVEKQLFADLYCRLAYTELKRLDKDHQRRY